MPYQHNSTIKQRKVNLRHIKILINNRGPKYLNYDKVHLYYLIDILPVEYNGPRLSIKDSVRFKVLTDVLETQAVIDRHHI